MLCFGQSLDSMWNNFSQDLMHSTCSAILKVETISSDLSEPTSVYSFKYQIIKGLTQVDFDDRGLRLVSNDSLSVLIDRINKSVTVRPSGGNRFASFSSQLPSYDPDSKLRLESTPEINGNIISFSGTAPARTLAPVESKIEVSFDRRSKVWLHTLVTSERKETGFDAVRYSWVRLSDEASPVTMADIVFLDDNGLLKLNSSFEGFELRLQEFGS